MKESSAIVIPPGLISWLGQGERGLSSNQIVEHIVGVAALPYLDRGRDNHPRDYLDVRRCRLLLEQVPSLNINDMANCSPEWAAIAASWPLICRTMDRECSDWRTNATRQAPDTNAIVMQAIA